MRSTALAIAVAAGILAVAGNTCTAEMSLRTTSGRSVFRRGEIVDLSLQYTKKVETGRVLVEFILHEGGTITHIGSDSFTPAAGRPIALTYSFDTHCLRAGTYTLAVRLTLSGERFRAETPLEITPLHRITDFAIIHRGIPRWLQHTNDTAAETARLGFNTVFTPLSSSWNRNSPGTRLTEPELAAEELLRRNISFVMCPVLPELGGPHAPGQAALSWFDPEVIDASAHLLEYHTQACRRFPNFLGINAVDQPSVPWSDIFMDARFRSVTGLDTPGRRDTSDVDRYVAYQIFRNHTINDFHALMKSRIRRIDPAVRLASQTSAGVMPSEGMYPPANTAFDILSMNVFDHWPGSNNWAAFAASLRRANRSVFTNRPLWTLTGSYGIMPDQWRTAWALAMSEKLEGHGYSLNAEELHTDRPWAEFSLAEIARINRILQRYGNFFLKLERRVEPLALWYSLAQASAEPDSGYEQEVAGAFLALKRAHFPVSIVTDEDIRAGLLGEHKVLFAVGVNYVQDDLRESIENFRSEGGRLVADRASMAFEAAVRMDADFREFAESMAEAARAWNENRTADAMRLRRCTVAEVSIRRQLDAVKRTLLPLVERPAYADTPDVFITVQHRGRAKYVFLVNVASEYRHPNEAERWVTMREAVPISANITIPSAPGRIAYDLWTGRRLQLNAAGSVSLRLPPGGLTVLCLLPYGEPGVPDIRMSVDEQRPGTFYFGTDSVVRDGGIVPAHVILKRPDGTVAFEKYDTINMSGSRWSYPMASNEPGGDWCVTIRNLLTGAERYALMPVGGLRTGTRPIITRRGPVAAFDSHAYAPFVKRSQLTISPGSGTERFAELLALRVNADIRPPDALYRRRDARNVLLVRHSTAHSLIHSQPEMHNTPASITTGRNLILIGSPENNKLIREINQSGILRAPITRETLGPGQAMLAHVWSPFDSGLDAVIIAAYDEDGLQAGYERFLTLSGLQLSDSLPRDVELLPEVRQFASRTAGSEPAGPAGNFITPSSHLRVEDGIRKLASGGGIVAVGTMDSRLLVLNGAGRLLWSREFDYRVLGCAVSAGGEHVAAAAFPRTYLFDREGKLLMLTAVEEPSRHDVEGLAMQHSPRPMLFQGTWTGQVFARDTAGSLKWQFGATPPDSIIVDVKRPAPHPIGPVRAIAPLSNNTIAVGGMHSLVILDDTGGEIKRRNIDRLQDLKPAGSNILAASFNRNLMMLNARAELLWQRTTPDFIMAIDVSADGRRFAAALFGGRVQVFDSRGRLTHDARLPFEATLTGVAFVDDGDAVWLSTWEGDLVKWVLE